ncbi:Yip1 family protein [Bacillus sp. CLL-7-23]|uniref:Yip1 family protein n=1 Tax=Bacillus changyiensis TaxID=3004103 RepID=A0ABT4X1W0_9BACI|nr:Yip1 family protein [Bacillus changyiensis]MDA7026284.1 Yip1 family protein [Bacillus changyiensis]
METKLEKGLDKKPSILGLFLKPGVHFERMNKKPSIWLPFIIVLVINLVGVTLASLKIDYEELMKTTNFPKEYIGNPDAERALFILQIIGSIIACILLILAASLIYWLCVKISGGTTTFSKMFSMSLFISIVASFATLIRGIYIYFSGQYIASNVTTLASLIPSKPPLTGILNSVELFSILSFFLLAIGFEKVGGMSKKSAWISTVVLFMLLALSSIRGA